MFLFLLLAAVRLTPDQMFQLQVPYRYHVQIAQVVWHPTVGRHELEVSDFYANRVVTGRLLAPDPRSGVVTAIDLRLDDGITFPDDRSERFGSIELVWEGVFLVTISDREEHQPLWPPKPDP